MSNVQLVQRAATCLRDHPLSSAPCLSHRYIPSELGYGERGSPPKIGGGDVLVFTMEILQIKGDKV